MFKSLITVTSALALSVVVAAPLAAESASGSYLAGRQAARHNDFSNAADYFTRALARQPNNEALMEDAIIANLALGRIQRALPLAQRLESKKQRSQAAHMVVIADLLQREDYEAYLDRDPETQGIGPLVDGLLQAWAEVGADRFEDALASFDTVAAQPGLQGFAMYHKALALANSGDLQAAEDIFANRGGGSLVITRRGATARAEILSQLGRNDEALSSLRDAFGTATDPELADLIGKLEAGDKLPITHITSARDGIAEVFFSLAGALRGDAGPEYTLLYARIAQHTRPDLVDALLLNAELLEELDQFDLAVAAYKGVDADHPAFHAAELGRVGAYREAGKPDAAIEVLEQLGKRFPELASVHSTLGDIFRQQDRFEDAAEAYDKAVSLSEEGRRGLWFLFYARAIVNERLDLWTKAESDFRKALELNPGQPQVLNYLGYSMVEKEINLDEALGMIEQAVEASPESGYIVDSLGWVLYRLGRYDEAVVHMERAVELTAVDPVVNDHLGDVYWAVGRFREAEFQWSRALSFVEEDDPGEADPDRIRRKMEVGLDAVLEEEGSEPLKVAEDN